MDRRELGRIAVERARAAGKQIGRRRAGRDAEIRDMLLNGVAWWRIQAQLGVGRSMIRRVAREMEEVFLG